MFSVFRTIRKDLQLYIVFVLVAMDFLELIIGVEVEYLYVERKFNAES